jgi:hypothetical protein
LSCVDGELYVYIQEGVFLKYLCQEDRQKENVETLNTISEETVTETTEEVKSSSTVLDIVEVDSEAECSAGGTLLLKKSVFKI